MIGPDGREDETRRPSLDAPAPPRSPWQLLYGGAHRLRRWWWASRAAALPRPVVSVGNLGWGGGGKTPLVAAIAVGLRDRGRQVAILSRGYGGRGGGVRVVSDGGGVPLLGPSVAGDEPVLLAGELPGVAVVVGADRYEAGIHALERLAAPPDVFILDDGFSHLRLTRDLDLLAFPAADPFAGGRLPPAGRLREPLAAVERANAVLLTGCDDPGGGAELARALAGYGFRGPGFASRTAHLATRGIAGEPPRAGARALLVCGIARPSTFAAAARRGGYAILRELTFPDHHGYPARSLDRIRAAFRATGAEVVLTTAKDRVKLLGRLDLPLAEIPIRAEPEPAFWRWLEEALARVETSAGRRADGRRRAAAPAGGAGGAGS